MLQYELVINLHRTEYAQAVCKALAVDKELHPEDVQKLLSEDGAVLRVNFSAVEPKILRTAISSFYDFLTLAINTVDEFQ